MAEQPAILVVDNCPGDTHRALVQITQRPRSQVSLLSIDFDIGQDRPEGTEIVYLRENDDRLIEKLLTERIPSLSVLDRNKIIAFSGGNARIALAIARSAGSGSLTNLSDRQLIDRLFLDKRRTPDPILRRCAQVASLVYAFHVDAQSEQEPEYYALARLAEASPSQFYGSVAEFLERGIAQKRGGQRAILPQALAIHLALVALDRLPAAEILGQLNAKGNERLFRSFTRRLGQLHEFEQARRIGLNILQSDLSVADLVAQDDYKLTIFQNLAPLLPGETLEAMEATLLGKQFREITHRRKSMKEEFARLARSLAYEREYFERAATVLLDLAIRETDEDTWFRSMFLELFWFHLSWTQATPEQRYAYLDKLLDGESSAERRYAVEALGFALHTGPWTSSHDGNFGSRPRGQEWRPKIYREQNDWYRSALHKLVSLACDTGELAERAREIVGNELRGLIRIGLVDDVSRATAAIREKGFWPKGWRSLCEAMYFDSKKWPLNVRRAAERLEAKLRPESLVDRFSVYVLGEPWGIYSPLGRGQRHGLQDATDRAQDVGRDAIKDPDLWVRLAREAIAFKGPNNSIAFGYALAKYTGDVRSTWHQLVSIFRGQDSKARNPAILRGFISGAAGRVPDIVQSWLDEVVIDQDLGAYIIEFSLDLPMNRKSLDRLVRAIHVGRAPVFGYRQVGYGRRVDLADADALVEFLRTLASVDSDSIREAGEVLAMYIHGADSREIDERLLSFGRELLQSSHTYHHISDHDAYNLKTLARKCLDAKRDEELVRKTCETIVEAVKSDFSAAFNLRSLMSELVGISPKIVADVVLGSADNSNRLGEYFFGGDDFQEESSNAEIDSTTDRALLEWVNEEPASRITAVARYVRYYEKDKNGNLAWASIAKQLIDLPDVGISAAMIFVQRFPFGSHWGPYSSALARRRPLLLELTCHRQKAIRNWAKGALEKYDERINGEVESERASDERFE